jgi:hypothetical protein
MNFVSETEIINSIKDKNKFSTYNSLINTKYGENKLLFMVGEI